MSRRLVFCFVKIRAAGVQSAMLHVQSGDMWRRSQTRAVATLDPSSVPSHKLQHSERLYYAM